MSNTTSAPMTRLARARQDAARIMPRENGYMMAMTWNSKPTVARVLATNPSMSDIALSTLGTRSTDEKTLLSVIKHPNTPTDTLYYLIKVHSRTEKGARIVDAARKEELRRVRNA